MARRKELTIEAINGRLKAAKTGVAVLQRGDRLSLRATLPARPGSGKTKPSQQIISLSIYANLAGLETAEAKAFELGGLLAQRRFSWAEWESAGQGETNCCGYWVEQYHQHYLKLRQNDPQAELKWIEQEWLFLKRLPQQQTLTAAAIVRVVNQTVANSRTRQLICQCLSRFASFAQVEVDLSIYLGGYTPKRRKIPTDAEIVEAIDRIPHQQWKAIAALMAAYGLRDHEAFLATLEYVGTTLIVKVPPECKTSERDVRPLYPEWVDRWQLNDTIEIPKINPKQIMKWYGHYTAAAFRRYVVGFTPYDLRHAYAIRASVVFKLPIAVAAAWMGHSPEVHWKTYNKWISDEQHQALFDSILSNSDRPMSPS